MQIVSRKFPKILICCGIFFVASSPFRESETNCDESLKLLRSNSRLKGGGSQIFDIQFWEQRSSLHSTPPPFQAEMSRQQAWANMYVQQLFQHVYFKNISLFIMGWREAKFSYKIISCSGVGIITLKSNGQVTLRCSLFVRKKCLCQERFVIVKNW